MDERAWLRSEDEALAVRGAVALAERADPEALRAARDARPAVRQGVVTGLRRLGERDPMGFSELLDAWRAEPDPLVQAARVAAVCDPPLLADLALALLAVEVCAEATAVLRAAPDRGAADALALRAVLRPAWDLVAAAVPAHALPALDACADDAPPEVAEVVLPARERLV